MLKDISEWDVVGYGGKSTLEKEELKAPDDSDYIIKYPRPVNLGTSWEDVTELIAAKIGEIYGLEMMKVDIVTRKGRRGCLLKNFVKEQQADMNIEGGVLLANLEEYKKIQMSSSLKKTDLISTGFNLIQKFAYWDIIKFDFIYMQIFDILIGNQDRHPFNWMLLFFSNGDIKFSPIYDNGASLGWRFTDDNLLDMCRESSMNKYMKNTKVKAGMFERKSVRGKDLLEYMSDCFPVEFEKGIQKLMCFNMNEYTQYIESINILTKEQKTWLLKILPFRHRKILQWAGKEEEE